MSEHGMNAYVHAPKNDLYQRTYWRDPYPAAEMAEYAREVRFAGARGIDWIPNLSPALPMIPTPQPPSMTPSLPLCFSCPDDLQAVLAKLAPFGKAGARTFMISFDDVVKGLTDPRDVAAYGGNDDAAFGRANGDFLTRLLAALRSRWRGARLLTVGADYSGTADTPYLTALRTTLAKPVEVMWTGTSIPARNFSPADAAAYGRAIGRRPLLWDNWTNDDSTGNAVPQVGTVRIFLGPYHHRRGIAREIGGIFLNPANEAELNLLPLATATDFMRAPRRYRPRRSWLAAVDEVAGGAGRGVREALRAFAETSYSTKLGGLEAPTFRRFGGRLLDRYRKGGRWPAAFRALVVEQKLVIAAPQRLQKLPSPAFATEAQPFLDAARQAADTGLTAARMLARERPALTVKRRRGGFAGHAAPPDPGRVDALRSRYQDGRTQFIAARRFTYGWRDGFGFDIPPYDAAPNALEEFLDAVDVVDSQFRQTQDEAASSVRVLVAGRPVELAPGGDFSLDGDACGRTVVTVDGAGGKTALRLARCRRR
jgi:hyaluronoglucosaminidase